MTNADSEFVGPVSEIAPSRGWVALKLRELWASREQAGRWHPVPHLLFRRPGAVDLLRQRADSGLQQPGGQLRADQEGLLPAPGHPDCRGALQPGGFRSGVCGTAADDGLLQVMANGRYPVAAAGLG